MNMQLTTERPENPFHCDSDLHQTTGENMKRKQLCNCDLSSRHQRDFCLNLRGISHKQDT